MKAICIDISGRVYKYDESLYNSIMQVSDIEDKIICLTPYEVKSVHNETLFKLISLIPKNKANSFNLVKRLLKAVECLINYCRLVLFVKKWQPDVIHFQWLPFLELCMIEFNILKIINKICVNTKIVLTVHNIYPHDVSIAKRNMYKNRFVKIGKLIDYFIVHTNKSSLELKQEFYIESDRINIINHGVFIPSNLPKRNRVNDGKCRFLMFGFQSSYKGTDLLIDALNRLTHDIKEQIEVRIIGQFSSDLYEKVQGSQSDNVYINNSFVSDSILYEEIVNSDVLVYPYRKISQSGALLLGLYFNKPLILSDLSSFKETLKNYPIEMFFENENVDSLKEAILNYLNSDIEYKDNLLDILNKVKEDNSWGKAAQHTLQLYHRITKERYIDNFK